MLTFKLISFVDGFYHYEIYPEGKISNKGWFIFNPKAGIAKEKVAPINGTSDWLGMFLSGIKDKNGNYKKSKW